VEGVEEVRRMEWVVSYLKESSEFCSKD